MGTIETLHTMAAVAGSCTGFAVAGSATPGPNNLMLTLSAARFGTRRTVPHLLGVAVGFTSLVAVCALGLGQIFIAYPTVQTVMRYIGAAYMLYLAWLILGSDVSGSESRRARPLTFIEAFLFQYINPKAWLVGVGAVSSFTLSGDLYWPSAFAVVVTFGVLILPCISLWVWFGSSTRQYLAVPSRRKLFNALMAMLVVISIVFIFV